MSTSVLEQLIKENGGTLTDKDLAHLADWANRTKREVQDPEMRRALCLIREGADTLLRRRSFLGVSVQ